MHHSRSFLFVSYDQLSLSERSPLNACFYALTRLGQEPVICFFALSGFLVGGPAIDRMLKHTFDLTDYVVDRCSRIFPPLIASLLLTWTIAAVVVGPVNGWHMVGNLLSLQPVIVPPFADNSPLWSLSYEVWFYALVAVVAVTARQRFTVGLCVVALLVATLLSLLQPVYLFCWLLGIVAYALRRFVRPNKSSAFIAIALLILAVAMLQLASKGAIKWALLERLDAVVLKLYPLLQLLLAGACGYLFIVAIELKPRTRIALASERFGTYCAGFSYSLYLTHYPLLQLLSYLRPGQFEVIGLMNISIYAVAVVACCVIAWVISLFVERNVLTIRTALRRHLANQDPLGA